MARRARSYGHHGGDWLRTCGCFAQAVGQGPLRTRRSFHCSADQVPVLDIGGANPRLVGCPGGQAVAPGAPSGGDDAFVSEEEFREFVDRAAESDMIEDNEAELIHSVFDFGDTLVRSVMVPPYGHCQHWYGLGPRNCNGPFPAFWLFKNPGHR